MVGLMLGNLLHSFDWGLPEGEGIESFGMGESFGITVCRKEHLLLVAKVSVERAVPCKLRGDFRKQ